MGRHRPRYANRIEQSEEAKALLRDDVPERIKWELRLALKGGRQERRRCLSCGKVGTRCKVWTSKASWNIEATGAEAMRVYWLCEGCNTRFAEAGGLPPELQRKLHG